ncbi:hypothetical protein EJ04DRAFT_353890 [Polyplosphaeria fusca]|uniref:Uncharacterized protein n=1 Tax=Polyplosphaeria fusca TaxID=682080 RepID=A0A9P4R923_9PLEO|nr:hypothetical protein EJ04DRAFT_353890 [Polyplosphaeria fusca]
MPREQRAASVFEYNTAHHPPGHTLRTFQLMLWGHEIHLRGRVVRTSATIYSPPKASGSFCSFSSFRTRRWQACTPALVYLSIGCILLILAVVHLFNGRILTIPALIHSYNRAISHSDYNSCQ